MNLVGVLIDVQLSTKGRMRGFAVLPQRPFAPRLGGYRTQEGTGSLPWGEGLVNGESRDSH
jgi:hypothetical protein